MTRRALVAVCLAALLVVSASAAVAAPSDLSTAGGDPLTAAAESLPADTVRYDGNPGWIVTVGNNSSASLDDWANASDDRQIVREPGDDNRAVVSAPKSHVGTTFLARLLDTGLAYTDYVESVEPELVLSYAAPVNPRSNATYEKPSGALYVGLTNRGVQFSKAGMAFDEDADETTLKQARDATGSTDVSSTGNGVLVATIDTGTNVQDGQVFGNGSANSTLRIHNDSKSFISGESVDTSADDYAAIEDGNGHGTWVSAAVAANTTNDSFDGFAPDADLLVLKALADDGSGSSDDIARSIRYAADRDADVISMSLGSPVYTQEIASAVRYAEEQGSIVVVAAGNSRQTTKWVASPSDTPGSVITVAAANTSQNVNATLPAYFSQIGPDPGSTDLSKGATEGQGITVSAPGMKTTALTPTTAGTQRETTLSGTSMATPMVAGGIAQVLANNPELKGDPATVHDRLVNASRPMPNATTSAVGSGYLAVGNLDAGTSPNRTQTEAMTADAEARDKGLDALADTTGGLLFRTISTTTSLF